jgi:hypothetical protein
LEPIENDSVNKDNDVQKPKKKKQKIKLGNDWWWNETKI